MERQELQASSAGPVIEWLARASRRDEIAHAINVRTRPACLVLPRPEGPP